MAFLTTPDPMTGLVEVDRMSVPGSAEEYLNLCPNYHVGAADWSRGAATSSESSKLPTARTTPKETSSRPTPSRSLSDV